MKPLRPARSPWLCAALLSVAACNQPAPEKQPGVCQSDGESCTATTDCCSGFTCEAGLCVFNGVQSNSSSSSSGGSSSSNSSSSGSGNSSSSSGFTTGDSTSSSSGSSSSSSSSSGGFVTAPHSTTQVPFDSGPVLTNPVLVTITFDDDPNQATLQQFGKFLVQSNWYAQISPQFSLGTASEVDVDLDAGAPTSIDDSVIQTNVAALIQAGTAPGLNGGGVTLQNAVYVAYYPATTSITLQGQAVCSVSAGGYHNQSTLSTGQSFSYAVVTDCEGQLPVPSPDNIEWSASHEFIEAATDPLPETDPAWQINATQITPTTNPWAAIGGEVADLCTGIFPQWSEGGYPAINRVWSDSSAASGGDPCLPEPAGDPYYSTDLEPQTFVPVSAGSQTTFTVTGWSTAAVPDWQIFAENYEGTFTANATLSAATLNNGLSATLTVAVPAGTPSQTYATVDVISGQSQNQFTSTIVGVYVP